MSGKRSVTLVTYHPAHGMDSVVSLEDDVEGYARLCIDHGVGQWVSVTLRVEALKDLIERYEGEGTDDRGDAPQSG